MRNMTAIIWLTWVFVGCGPANEPPVEDELITPPERVERPTPGIDEEPEVGDAPEIETPVIDPLPEEPAEAEEVACCETTFVLPDGVREEDEVSAILVGGAAPLNVEGGIPLTYADGAWSATACIPPEYNAGYHYVVSIADENGDVVYESVRTNPNVATGFSEAGEINLWDAAETCDGIDIGVHALKD